MKTSLLVLLVLACAGVASAQTTDLMISEYVEGSGYNKAIEIFNGTGDTVNLAGYALEIYYNGTTTPVTIPLDAVDVPAEETHVVTHASFGNLTYADQTDANLNFNGNDAVVLSFDGTPVDRLGRVGEDPGSSWSCDAGSTLNHTLRRLIGVCEGDANVGDVFDPCSGWQFYASDTINGLGFHIADCGAVPNGTVSWSAVKAGYR